MGSWVISRHWARWTSWGPSSCSAAPRTIFIDPTSPRSAYSLPQDIINSRWLVVFTPTLSVPKKMLKDQPLKKRFSSSFYLDHSNLLLCQLDRRRKLSCGSPTLMERERMITRRMWTAPQSTSMSWKCSWTTHFTWVLWTAIIEDAALYPFIEEHWGGTTQCSLFAGVYSR